jgi:hypothetical protein
LGVSEANHMRVEDIALEDRRAAIGGEFVGLQTGFCYVQFGARRKDETEVGALAPAALAY